MLHLGLPYPYFRQEVCHRCVSLCHPLKRCTAFVHRGCVSVSPFFENFVTLNPIERNIHSDIVKSVVTAEELFK